jgi:hypothetical protein
VPLTVGPVVVAAGFVAMMRIGVGRFAYWADVFPAVVLVACGMGLSVAPLTAAVLAAVDGEHAGEASGVDDAVSSVAFLMATALIGFVLASAGSTRVFMAQFHQAALIGAGLAAVAAVVTLVLIRAR